MRLSLRLNRILKPSMPKYTRVANRLYVYHGKRRDTYVTIDLDGKYKALGHTREEAEAKLLEQAEHAPGTIAHHFVAFMKARKVAPGTLKNNKAERENLVKVFGKMRPKDIRPMHIKQYMNLSIENGRGGSANREKALLSALFQYLSDVGHFDSNPCKEIKKNTSTFKAHRLTDKELRDFLKFARAYSETGALMADIAELSYLTGQRQGDVLSLDRRQLNKHGIEFRQQKTGTEVLIEWTPRLKAVVERCLARKSTISTTHVIRSSKGQRYSSQGFKAMWNRLQVLWGQAGNQRFRFHDLRAKAVTKMLEDGRRASDVSGHLSESAMEQHYDGRVQRRGKAVE